jgi:secreted Zn-dependent insulinase-like peptidase
MQQVKCADAFSEHLLFMGTKTYPSENEYSQYLSAHNGHSNAWTAMTSTVYFFDVSADALEGALDRFSGFFYEPLFNEVSRSVTIYTGASSHQNTSAVAARRLLQPRTVADTKGLHRARDQGRRL